MDKQNQLRCGLLLVLPVVAVYSIIHCRILFNLLCVHINDYAISLYAVCSWTQVFECPQLPLSQSLVHAHCSNAFRVTWLQRLLIITTSDKPTCLVASSTQVLHTRMYTYTLYVCIATYIQLPAYIHIFHQTAHVSSLIFYTCGVYKITHSYVAMWGCENDDCHRRPE